MAFDLSIQVFEIGVFCLSRGKRLWVVCYAGGRGCGDLFVLYGWR